MQLDPDRLYTSEELAPMLRVSRETLRRWARQGRLPVVQPAGRVKGARMLFRGRDVLALIGGARAGQQ